MITLPVQLNAVVIPVGFLRALFYIGKVFA